MSTLARKQHYLPQFYLRGFSHGGTHLYQIDKTTGRHFGLPIRDAAAVRDFYALDYEGAADANAVEKALAEMEAVLAQQLKALLRDGVRNQAACNGVIELLSLLRYRVPAVKRHIEASLASHVRNAALQLERAGRLPPPPEGLREALRVENLNIAINNWKCMEHMMQMAADPAALSIMLEMRCTLFEAPFGESFITGDQPVCFYHPMGFESGEGVGPLTPGVEITLPLSARFLLRLDHEPGVHVQYLASSSLVQEFNRRTIVLAENYLFCAAAPERHLQGIAAWRHCRAGFHHETLRTDRGTAQLQRYLSVPRPDQVLLTTELAGE